MKLFPVPVVPFPGVAQVKMIVGAVVSIKKSLSRYHVEHKKEVSQVSTINPYSPSAMTDLFNVYPVNEVPVINVLIFSHVEDSTYIL